MNKPRDENYCTEKKTIKFFTCLLWFYWLTFKCTLFYFTVSMETTVGAGLGMCVLVIIFFLYMNRKWCFSHSSNNKFICCDEKSLGSKTIHSFSKLIETLFTSKKYLNLLGIFMSSHLFTKYQISMTFQKKELKEKKIVYMCNYLWKSRKDQSIFNGAFVSFIIYNARVRRVDSLSWFLFSLRILEFLIS